MKKIITGIAAVAMAASLFAVDFSATVQVKGDIAYGQATENSSSFNLFGFENTKQKDADLLEVHFSGDRAGADFKFWASVAEPTDYWNGGSGNNHIAVGGQYGDKLNIVTLRGLKVWFKPIDMMTVSAGNVGLYLYTERLNWWKVPMGGSVSQFQGWGRRWSSAAGLKEAVGLTLEVTPIDGLYLGAGVAPGAGSSLLAVSSSKNGDTTTTTDSYLAWGAVAKYTFSDLGLSIGAAFRDDGKNDMKLLTAGADFGVDNFYGFLQGKFLFDGRTDNDSWKGPDSYGITLRGITIDNYLSYNFGFMNLQATLPVTIRGLAGTDAEKKADPSYMTARIKASFPVDAITAYVVVGSDEGFNNGPAGSAGNAVWTFDDTFGDSFNIYVNPGVSFNVGACALDIGAEFAFQNAADGKGTFYWAVPFTTKVSF